MDKSEISPLYRELQGYLSQLPLAKDVNETMLESPLWKNINQVIDTLNAKTGIDYSRYKVVPERDTFEIPYANLSAVRGNLNALVNRLHAEYFSAETAPFSGGPKAVFSQTQVQTQIQTVFVQMILDVQEKIVNALKETKDPKEKGFLNKVKESLSTARNITELLTLIFNAANQFGISPEMLLNIFSK
jgi:hypothetical protein